MSRLPFEKLTPAAHALIRRASRGHAFISPICRLTDIARAAFWYGYAKGVRDLDSGAGQKLADKDQRLGEPPLPDDFEGMFQRSEPRLAEDVNPTLFAKVIKALAAQGVQIAPELIAALNIDAVLELENREFAGTPDFDNEHPAPGVIGDDHSVHIGTPCGQAESVDPAGAAGEVDKPRATTAIRVLDNIKLAVGALSAHGEHERVNQLLDTYERVAALIAAARKVSADCGHLADLQAALADIGGAP